MARILVTDDDPLQLNLRRLVLEQAGHEVECACSAAETLAACAQHSPDLLIMDLRLPNEAGHSDAQAGMKLIREVHGRAPQSEIIVLSGWPEELYGSPEESMVTRIMVKPVPTGELLSAIEAVVQRP